MPPFRVIAFIVTLAFVFALPAVGRAASEGELRARAHRVVARVEAAKVTLRWFQKHPAALYSTSPHTRRVAWHAVNLARQRVILGRAELARIHTLLVRKHRARAAWAVPDWFMQQALCVHDGYWHQAHAPFARTGNVPDGIRGGLGEAPWNNRSYYRGGMQFAFSTWERAGGHGDPADAPPAEQVYRAYVIVVKQDGGSWHEWPETSRACGWR